MIQPFSHFLAAAKSSLTLFAPTPTYIYWNSEATSLMKLHPDQLAKALASMVLPVPGGPQNITPLLILAPICQYFSEFLMKSMISLNFSLISSPPQQSLKKVPFQQILLFRSTGVISGLFIFLTANLNIIAPIMHTPAIGTKSLTMDGSLDENSIPLSLCKTIYT